MLHLEQNQTAFISDIDETLLVREGVVPSAVVNPSIIRVLKENKITQGFLYSKMGMTTPEKELGNVSAFTLKKKEDEDFRDSPIPKTRIDLIDELESAGITVLNTITSTDPIYTEGLGYAYKTQIAPLYTAPEDKGVTPFQIKTDQLSDCLEAFIEALIEGHLGDELKRKVQETLRLDEDKLTLAGLKEKKLGRWPWLENIPDDPAILEKLKHNGKKGLSKICMFAYFLYENFEFTNLIYFEDNEHAINVARVLTEAYNARHPEKPIFLETFHVLPGIPHQEYQAQIKAFKTRAAGAVVWDFDGVLNDLTMENRNVPNFRNLPNVTGNANNDIELIYISQAAELKIVLDILYDNNVNSYLGSQRNTYSQADQSRREELFAALDKAFGKDRPYLTRADAEQMLVDQDLITQHQDDADKVWVLDLVQRQFGIAAKNKITHIDDNTKYQESSEQAGYQFIWANPGEYEKKFHLADILLSKIHIDIIFAGIEKHGAEDNALKNRMNELIKARAPDACAAYEKRMAYIHSEIKKCMELCERYEHKLKKPHRSEGRELLQKKYDLFKHLLDILNDTTQLTETRINQYKAESEKLENKKILEEPRHPRVDSFLGAMKRSKEKNTAQKSPGQHSLLAPPRRQPKSTSILGNQDNTPKPGTL